MKYTLLFIIGCSFGLIGLQACASNDEALLGKLKLQFADELNIHKHVVEFCPDNTCDAFIATNEVSNEELGTFIFIYLYYFSDYFILSEWRDTPEVKASLHHMLAQQSYVECDAVDKKCAANVLANLSRKGRIKINMIRYDEEGRHVDEYNIEEIIRFR